MQIRKFDRATLESEPHNVLFKDLYPWDEIDETPFGASLAVVEPGGQTMVHSHNPCETFVICHGKGTMTINDVSDKVATGDVIYMHPQSVHTIKNDSDSEPLMFLSVFWDAPYEEEEEAAPAPAAVAVKPRVLLPSPPTSNGPLHLGHLSGPYLMADAFKRFSLIKGIPARWVCLSDDHQSYVAEKGSREDLSPAETAQKYGGRVLQALQAFDAAPDKFIRPATDTAYQEHVKAAFLTLHGKGLLQEREVDTLRCADCERTLYDGYVYGECPHCGAGSRGFCCESCCLPNETVDLKEPECITCEATPEVVKTRRLFFPLAPFAEKLAQYHANLRLTPKLRALGARFVADAATRAPSATVVGTWGIPVPVPGFEGQIISPWFEVALAAGYVRQANEEAAAFFGYDNAFLYLAHDPAVSLALDLPLADAMGPNEYLLLNDFKMSTSGEHALDAVEVLAKVPSDLLRLYLAGVRPEDTQYSCSVAAMAQLTQLRVIGPWQNWLERLGKSLTAEASSKAPEPSQFSPEHHEFYGHLNTLLARASRGYETFALQEVARVLHELIERASIFSITQSHLAGIPSLQGQRASALALELAAARTLCVISAPLMPRFAAQLWKFLGFRTTLEQEGWPAQAPFVPPGQRVLAAAGLSSRKFFPANLDLEALLAETIKE